MLVLQKEKIVDTGILYYNMLRKYRVMVYSSKFLTLKANAQYLLKKFRKKIRFEKNLRIKSQSNTDSRCKITKQLYKHVIIFT